MSVVAAGAVERARPVDYEYGAARAAVLTRGTGLTLLAGYFALQVLLRTLVSPSADLDEADQLVLTQKFSWGYGPQPPLYTWLQMACFALFGPSILALSLLKNVLLFGTYLATWFTARLITGSRACAFAAAISLLFMPRIVWESQRDLTHSVLSGALAAATLACFLKAHRSKTTAWYLAFGVCVGLGLLSKYNYALLVLGLLLAALSLSEFRGTVCRPAMLAALLLALGLFLPNGLWILRHQHLAFLTASKFELQYGGSWAGIALTGVWQVVVALISFLAPLALAWLALCLRPLQQPSEAGGEAAGRRLLGRMFLFLGGLILVLVIGFRATGFRERWLQPLFISAPVLAAAWCQRRLDQVRLRRMAWAGLAVMVVVPVALLGRIVLAERLRREEPLTHPYQELAAQLQSAVPEGALVLAESQLLGGNLRLVLPHRLVVTPDLVELFSSDEPHCALVWDATAQPTPPETLLARGRALAGASPPAWPPRYLSAAYLYHHRKQLRLGLLALK